MNYKPFCSTEILFVNKEAMIERLLRMNAEKIALVMSEKSMERWNFEDFITDLESTYNLTWIRNIAANPTQKDVVNALHQLEHIDTIIAIGGGSAIDLAKAISAFLNSPHRFNMDLITQSIKDGSYKNNHFIDIIAVPTTAGSGSEVTQWSTIWDENQSGKFSLDSPELKPKMAIIVPELTLTLPIKVTISTVLDAMSQAIEAYWSKHTTPIVQEIAYRAIKIIVQNLRKAVEQPNNIGIREKLCRASVLAGLAFSQTRTTACHSISYPLTMLFDVPHGFAAAIALDAVGSINRGHFMNDNELFELFDKDIQKFIDDVCEGIISLRLSTFGIKESDIPRIVDKAFTSGRMDNNPVDLSREDVSNILKSVL